MRTAGALIKTLRPHQWVKNLFVAAPLVFGKKLGDVPATLRAAAALAAFCALSSAVSPQTAALAVDKDRAHPTKKTRPIAAGILSPRFAVAVAAVLAAAALAGAAALDWRFGAVALGYLALNIVYSLHIKELAFL